MDTKVQTILQKAARGHGLITVLTGAGISAESGIPTFRGKEGYWTVGSAEYHPQEMATHAMYRRCPEDVWVWYLYRRGICNAAAPNEGHSAVARIEKALKSRFILITQNVDGLHLRAGSSIERTYQIHGNINHMRCGQECSPEIYPIPGEIGGKSRGDTLSSSESALLICPRCGSRSRPHILWFDECYNEEFYRFQSSLAAAFATDLLIVVGTSGSTNLPMQVGSEVLRRGGMIIDVNPDYNPFSGMAEESGSGLFLQGKSSETLPGIADFFEGYLKKSD